MGFLRRVVGADWGAGRVAPYGDAMSTVEPLLIRGARLVAIDTEAPTDPVDVLLEDGRVTRVGAGVDAPGVATYDADGRWLAPGLWDAHVHLAQWTMSSARLDLAGARSAEQAVRLVAERLEEWPEFPVIGWGHRPTAWPEDPVVSMLDELDTDQPVILIAGDGHHAWLNTTALIALALPVREGLVAEAEWFRAYGRLSSCLLYTSDAADE